MSDEWDDVDDELPAKLDKLRRRSRLIQRRITEIWEEADRRWDEAEQRWEEYQREANAYFESLDYAWENYKPPPPKPAPLPLAKVYKRERKWSFIHKLFGYIRRLFK